MIALQGFGGVMAIIQYELVEKRHWLTREEFIEEWAVAQILPGPNVVNLSLMMGARFFGLRGALAALAGMLFVPSIIALILGVLYGMYSSHPGVVGATRGMSAVAAGLIMAAGLRLLPGLRLNPLGKALCATLAILCFVCIALLRWPLLHVLITLGPLAIAVTYRILKARHE